MTSEANGVFGLRIADVGGKGSVESGHLFLPPAQQPVSLRCHGGQGFFELSLFGLLFRQFALKLGDSHAQLLVDARFLGMLGSSLLLGLLQASEEFGLGHEFIGVRTLHCAIGN